MRIVGGKFKGKGLANPKSNAIRPTTDRGRESVFNILTHGLDVSFHEKRVLDLFAGTGALGFEALSRGAQFALFIDQASEARALIRRNMEALQMNGQAKIFRRDATKLGECGTMPPFDLAFLDPPYGHSLAEPALLALHNGGWLKKDAILVLEESAEAEISLPAPFTLLQLREYGMTKIRFLTYIS